MTRTADDMLKNDIAVLEPHSVAALGMIPADVRISWRDEMTALAA